LKLGNKDPNIIIFYFRFLAIKKDIGITIKMSAPHLVCQEEYTILFDGFDKKFYIPNMEQTFIFIRYKLVYL